MIRIVTDSSADIPQHIAEALDIAVVPLRVSFGNETFRDGIDMTHDVFYERLIREAPNMPKTSIPSPTDFEDVFREILEEDDENEIISIHPSSSLTGVYNLACLIAQQVDVRAGLEHVRAAVVQDA